MIVYDTETCGLHGMCVLIQYQYNDEPIQLYNVWEEPIEKTLKLIEWFMSEDNIGFNLAYDHFHLCKLYTVLSLVPDPETCPEEIINEIAELEPYGRDGLCLKPKRACDIMLHCRKGKYQNTMQRKDIKIKKVHVSVAWEVRDYLEETIKLDDIYFANRKNTFAPRWAVFDSDEGSEWKDIVLKFKPSGALKTLAVHALGYDKVIEYQDLTSPQLPLEVGYAPFAKAISSKEGGWKTKIRRGSGFKIGYTWPYHIQRHIDYWYNNPKARQYASDDVKYTRELWEHLGSPESGDDDSELACMVGANRWRGYKVDFKKLAKLEEKILKDLEEIPRAPNAVRDWLMLGMTNDEKEMFDLITEGSTKKVILEDLSQTWEGEVGRKAGLVLRARQGKYHLDLINKLKAAGRFHVSAEVIGALSGRKSGRGGDLNSQGIARQKEIRECFTLALPDMILCGGDFEAFEVTLAIAVYCDKKLEEDVKSGKKIHALFGEHVYPDMTYEQILEDKEKYTRSKSAVFAMIYGGEAYTLKNRLGVSMEAAEEAYQSFLKEYPDVGKGRKKIFDMFCSMRQPNGVGTKIFWKEPRNYIETLFGFRRYFTLENQICKALFNLAQKPPDKWNSFKGSVQRRDRQQTVLGAIQSALYAAAFTLQAANMRAAGNHIIQGSGAQITKRLERNIWDMQPHGVNKWLVQPMNEHDEIMCPCVYLRVSDLNEIVKNTVKSFTDKVSLLAIDWHNDMESWAEK